MRKPREIPTKWHTRCVVLTKDGGDIHLHSVFGRMREVLYQSPRGDWYRVPRPMWPTGDVPGLFAMDPPAIVAELLPYEVT